MADMLPEASGQTLILAGSGIFLTGWNQPWERMRGFHRHAVEGMPDRAFQRSMEKPSIDRWKQAVELGKKGAVDLLISSLDDEDKWVRCLVIDALGNIHDPRVVDPLISALGDLDRDVRFMAAAALGRVGDTRALDALRRIWESDDSFVRDAAGEAIARLAMVALRPEG